MGFTPIVQQLVDYLNDPSNKDIKVQFQQSFELAHSTGLEIFNTQNVHTIDDYLKFIDAYVHWIPTENSTGTNVYEHLCLFYFVIDLPPISEQQSPIDPNTKSPYRWLSQWLIDYAKVMGEWMKTPASISQATVESFRKVPSYRMQDYIEPPGGWKTFNDFFARKIKPGLRPVTQDTKDTLSIVSPADCRYKGTWNIDDNASITTFPVKGVPWSISQLLADTEYGPKFAGGQFTHSFLGPNDYHRQHAPVSGKVVEAKVIPGICYLEVVLKASENGPPKLEMHRAVTSKYEVPSTIPFGTKASLDVPDTAGYQFLQARGLVLIDNPDIGLVAVLPTGMAHISSVKLSVTQGQHIEKGEEISCFHFGGSDVIMVFQKNDRLVIDQTEGEHYNVGTKVATAPLKPRAK